MLGARTWQPITLASEGPAQPNFGQLTPSPGEHGSTTTLAQAERTGSKCAHALTQTSDLAWNPQNMIGLKRCKCPIRWFSPTGEKRKGGGESLQPSHLMGYIPVACGGLKPDYVRTGGWDLYRDCAGGDLDHAGLWRCAALRCAGNPWLDCRWRRTGDDSSWRHCAGSTGAPALRRRVTRGYLEFSRRCSRVESWPQAAAMSSPRSARTLLLTPPARKRSRKARIASPLGTR